MGKLFFATICGAALCFAGIASASDSIPDPELEELAKRQKLAEARKAEADAKTAQAQAELAAAEARFGFLPKSGAEGKVTLGQGAGTIESNLLVSRAMQKVAKKIVADPKITDGTLLLAGDEDAGFDQLSVFHMQTFGVEGALTRALGTQPDVRACSRPVAGAAPAMAISALISSVAGALRTDTELQGVTTDATSAMLVRAVAGAKPGTFVAPTLLTVISVKAYDPIMVRLCELKVEADAANTAIPSKPGNAAAKKKATDLTAAIKRYDDFVAGLTTANEAGRVPLAQVYHLSLLEPKANGLVLRVYADKSGGSLLTRRNLWTALGAPAVGVSGGLVASYTLSDPRTGRLTSGASYRCATKLAGLRDVHGSREIKADCLSE